jgi:hypothetical protein
MLRVDISRAYIKRTIRPLYGWTQTTPKSQLLDPNWDRSTLIWPGMVMAKTAGDLVTLIGAAPMVPLGLCGSYIGGDGIDEIKTQGVNAVPVWVMAPDAEFEILAPAFDTTQAWVDPGNGSIALVYASTTGATRGKLVPAGTAGASVRPIARLLRVESATKIVIGGLTAGDA